jgi:ribonuclease P protein component
MAASLSRFPRVGIVVPKYGQNIVDRNRIKRRLRELTRIQVLPVIGGVDLLLRAKRKAYNSSFSELRVELDAVISWALETARQ